MVAGRLASAIAPTLTAKLGLDVRLAETDWRADLSPEKTALIGFDLPERAQPSDFAWVHSCGAGVDAFLDGGDWPEETLLTRTIGRLGEQIGEYCLSHVLADAQRHERYRAQAAIKVWQQEQPVRLADLSVTVVGTGGIGSKVGAVFAELGSRVRGVNRSGRRVEPFERVFSVEMLPGVIADSDVCIVALPGAAASTGVIDRVALKDARDLLLMNVGRGSSLVHADVIDALKDGRVRRAVLDVFGQEPLDPGASLWTTPGVTITPHVAGLTDPADVTDAFERLCRSDPGELALSPLVVDVERGY